MVQVNKYRGFRIMYYKQLFYAYINKEKVTAVSERAVNMLIDGFLQRRVDAVKSRKAELEAKHLAELKLLPDFHIVLDNRDLLLKPVMVMAELATEVFFVFDKSHLSCTFLDPANVAQCEFILNKKACAKWDVPKPFIIRLNLTNLRSVLMQIPQRDSITIGCAGTDSEKHPLIAFAAKGVLNSQFVLNTLDVSDKQVKMPELKFKSTISMPSKMLADAITRIGAFSESVAFSALGKDVVLSGAGSDAPAKVSIVLEPSNNVKIINTVDCKSKMSVEYLKKMMVKFNPDVKVQFSNDFPLRLEYVVKDKWSLSFLLAPRIEND